MAQRQLILIAKVMQNLANDTLPGKKEGYMERLNEFITSNQNHLRGFYADLNVFSSPPLPNHASHFFPRTRHTLTMDRTPATLFLIM